LKKKASNILFHYSLYSFLLTLSITTFLSFILIRNMETGIINTHSDLYTSFVEAIPMNYTEILFELTETGTQTGHKPESGVDHHDDGHKAEEPDSSIWSHFQTDLMQIPTVQMMKIFDTELQEKWSYQNEIKPPADFFPSMLSPENSRLESFHIMMRKPYYVIHYYIPIEYGDDYIGVVEITDVDRNLSELLNSSRAMISVILGLGGLVLYLTLFIVFYRSYRDQRTAIRHLDKSQSLTIHTMSLLAELRDNNTGSHITRTSRYCAALARALKHDKDYARYIDEDYIQDIERSAPLHDIGKVGIPDSILNKPEKLTEEEFEIMKKHPLYGAEILKTAIDSLDFRSYFEIGYQLVLHHHENWDGSGYPSGLKGEAIPLSARIMAVADVYDALRTRRPYKEPCSHQQTLDFIIENSGKKFDPRIIEAFLGISGEIEKISQD